MTRIPLIETSGPPRERGRQHGEAARERIERSLEVYAEAFAAGASLTWSEVRERAPRWLPLVEGFNGPELVEELEGIAEGARAPLADVLALNGRGELSAGNPFADEECTSWALTDEATPDGHVYAGQNWDWKIATQETVVLLRIEQPGKPTIVMQTEAGQIGRQGANSVGLALNANGLGGRWRAGAGLGLPQPFIRRRILDAWTFNGALHAIFTSRQSVCTNLLLTHRDGFAIDLETTPARHGWGYPVGGVLVHANHFRWFVPPQLAEAYRPGPSSLLRLERAEAGLRRVRDAGGEHEVRALVREAMSDHFSFPNSVCTHPDEREPTLERTMTIASSIVDLTTGEYRVAHGPPCENEYELLPWNLYDGPGEQAAALAGAAAA